MAIDWAAVKVSFKELQLTIKEPLDFVKDEAVKANETIGAEITQYLTDSRPESQTIVGELTQEIENKALTLEKAKEHLGKLKTILGNVREHLKPKLAQLPGPVAEKIRSRLEESSSQIGTIAQRIFDLLQ